MKGHADLADLEVAGSRDVDEPVGTEASSSDVAPHDQRAQAVFRCLILLPSKIAVVDDPGATLTPADVLREALAEGANGDGRVGRE